MSDSPKNEVTDSNVVEKQVVEKQVHVVNDDVPEDDLPESSTKNNSNSGDMTESSVPREKINYEVVFFARYNVNPRPSTEDVTKFFSNYGTVHHVNCPDGCNYAFIFMASLNTTAEHRRTRTTISQIINEMTPENRFHITVASSNRGGFVPHNNYPDQRYCR